NFHNLQCLNSTLINPTIRNLRFSGYSYFQFTRQRKINYVRLQLNTLFVLQISVFNTQMCFAQFGFHNPYPCRWRAVKTIITKTLSEYLFLLSTVKTLITNMLKSNLFVKQ